MSTVDFAKWAKTNLGNIAITYVHDISLMEFRRWQAEGHRVYLKGKPANERVELDV